MSELKPCVICKTPTRCANSLHGHRPLPCDSCEKEIETGRARIIEAVQTVARGAAFLDDCARSAATDILANAARPKMGEREKLAKKILQAFYNTAYKAVDHVAAANYPEREREAFEWIGDALGKAENELLALVHPAREREESPEDDWENEDYVRGWQDAKADSVDPRSTKPCPGCAQGDEPVLLDEDGTLARISGLPGRLGHAVDDRWWYCDDHAPSHPAREREVLRLITWVRDYAKDTADDLADSGYVGWEYEKYRKLQQDADAILGSDAEDE